TRIRMLKARGRDVRERGYAPLLIPRLIADDRLEVAAAILESRSASVGESHRAEGLAMPRCRIDAVGHSAPVELGECGDRVNTVSLPFGLSQEEQIVARQFVRRGAALPLDTERERIAVPILAPHELVLKHPRHFGVLERE